MISKLDFFKLCLKNKMYEDRAWVLSSFGIPTEQERQRIPFEPYVVEKEWVFSNGTELTKISHPVDGEALFNVNDLITITHDDLVNVKEDTKTTIGNVMFNAIVFVFPFEDKVSFVNKKINGKMVDGIVAKLLVDKKITPEDKSGKFSIAMGFLTVFTQILVPAASPKSLRSPPGIEKARDEFLAKNKHRMNTTEAAAELDTLLTDMLKDHLKGDISMNHLLSGKDFATVRKMLYGSIGAATSLDDLNKIVYTARSLKEGWTPEDMYAIANNLRTGSTLRGLETSVGGYTSKKLSRAYQNTRVKEDDCGSNIGMRMTLSPETYERYVGRYLVNTDKPLTKDDLVTLVGKEVIMRDSTACRTPAPGYCAKCLGDGIGKSGIGLGSQLAALGGTFLGIKLSMFHANELKLQEYIPERHFY